MKAKKIYESLEDFGFSQNEIIQFIKSKYGEPITLELEYERQDPYDCTDYLFEELNEGVIWDAKKGDIEDFDMHQRKWLVFTITGNVKDIIKALVNWWYVEKKDVYDFIKEHIV
jgi:hypothetical protein